MLSRHERGMTGGDKGNSQVLQGAQAAKRRRGDAGNQVVVQVSAASDMAQQGWAWGNNYCSQFTVGQ